MTRKALPKSKTKKQLSISVDPDVAREAKKTGNASEWFNDLGKAAIKKNSR